MTPDRAAIEARVADAQRGDPEAIVAVEAFDDWHLLRRTGVGGSDVAAILGLDPWRRPIDVWRVKHGLASDELDSEPARWGRILEPVIAHEYAERHKVELVGPLATQRSPDRHWHLFTVDRAVWRAGELERIVEIKARGWWRLREYGAEGTDEVPPPEWCQVAWYLAGLDVARADVVALFNTHDLREFPIARNLDLEADLLERVGAWWQRHIVEGVEPEPDGSKAYAEHLRTRFAGTLGDVVELPAELEQRVEQMRAVRCIGRRLAEIDELLGQEIARAIGARDGFDLGPGRGRLTYKIQRGRVNERAVVEELARRLDMGPRQLEALREQHRGPPGRVFRRPRAWSADQVADVSPAIDDALRSLLPPASKETP